MVAPKLDGKPSSEDADMPEVRVLMKNGVSRELPQPAPQPWTWRELILPYVGFLCCQILGFPAMIASLMSYVDYKTGDNASRNKKRVIATRLGLAAVIVGTIMAFVLIMLWFLPFMLMAANRRDQFESAHQKPQALPLAAHELGSHSRVYFTSACESSHIHPICPNKEERITVISASYGRTNQRTCSKGRPDHELEDQKCHATNSYQVMKEKCDTRRECHIAASNSVFGDPCVGTYKYLEVSFRCESQGPIRQPRPVSNNPDFREFLGMACEHERLQLVCPEGQSINVLTASYGRLDGAYCPDGPIKTTSCHAQNSDYEVRKRCDGRQRCNIDATNEVFRDPCKGTFKYLKVKYNCLVVNI